MTIKTLLPFAAVAILGAGAACKNAPGGNPDGGSPADGGANADAAIRSDAGPGTNSDAGTFPPCPQPLIPSGPLRISGQDGGVIEGLHVTSTVGDCVTISGSAQITLRASEVGPCAGNGIVVTGSSTSIVIADNYVHPEFTPTACCDTGDGVLIEGGSSGILVQGNVIAYSESNIELPDSASGVHVVGNFLLNPRGPFPRGQQVQAWHVTDVWVENNYGLSSTSSTYAYPENQEDAFNFGFTSGTVVAQNNYITGGHSASGCGLIADDAANGCQFLSNSLLNTGQCGIGIASGTNNVVDGNRVLNTAPVTGGGNTAIYVWNQYPAACGPTSVSNNVACQLKPDGSQSGYWNGGGCDPVTETNNIWDAQAQAMLSPASIQMPAPPIPPQPYACRATSPF